MAKQIWFTSDTHLGHANVIRYCNRPWSMVNEMDKALIERWNKFVKPNDTVYHLGDLCLTKRVDVIDGWLGQLNGTIRLVRGNHDVWTRRFDRLQNKHKIKWIKDYAERTFEVDGKRHKFVLCHFPMLSWHGSHRSPSSIMLHGHCHGSIQNLNQSVCRMDVGVDCNNWYPISLENIITMMEGRDSVEHHA